MNLYQGMNMNPVNFVDPWGERISSNTLKYWGSYDKALEYVKYNLGLYLAGGDSLGRAYDKLVRNGLVTDTGSSEDISFALSLLTSPTLDVFNVTPEQFAKDIAGGAISSGTGLINMAAKGLSLGNLVSWKQIDQATNYAQNKINQAIGANPDSLGYWMGSTYAPVVVGGILAGGYANEVNAPKSMSNYDRMLQKIEKLDFTTPANKAVFYSGPGQGVRANAFAQQTGGMTIEMTFGGRALVADPIFQSLSPAEQFKVWQRASEPFAKSASGSINAFIRGAKPDRTFRTIEEPILRANANIFRYIYHY